MECCLPKLDADSSKLEKVQLGLFPAMKPGSPSSVSACWGRISVAAQQHGPPWYQEWRNLREPLRKVNPSPDAGPSKVYEINVNTRVHTCCQTAFPVAALCSEGGQSDASGGRGRCLLPAQRCGLAAPWWEMACPAQEEEAAVMPPLC